MTRSGWSSSATGPPCWLWAGWLSSRVRVPVATGLSVGPDIGLYTFRGIMLGPITNYNLVNGDDSVQGFLKSGYIYDQGDRKEDILDNPVPPHRAFAEWQHVEQIGPDLTVIGDVNWSTDSEVMRDFHAKDFVPIQEPDNFLEADYTGQNYFISGFARFQPDAFYPVQQRLPEIRYDVLPTAIGGGIYLRFNSGIAHLEEVPPDGGSFLEEDRFDTFVGFTRPFSFRGIFDFTPVEVLLDPQFGPKSVCWWPAASDWAPSVPPSRLARKSS